MLNVRYFAELQDYIPIWEAMKAFTDNREPQTPDEIWVLQHHPVYTQGQNGRPEYLLNPQGIPVVQSDRGGQITYHGPGQLVIYLLIDLNQRGWPVRRLVSLCENAVIQTLKQYNVDAKARTDAPGVYVEDAKIASIGLRVRRGYTYHGLAFNLDMDLRPFQGIIPCGLQGIRMIQLKDITPNFEQGSLTHYLVQYLQTTLLAEAEKQDD